MIRLISDKVTAMLVFYVGQTESGWQEFIVRYTTLKVTQPAFHSCLCVYQWGFFCIKITYKIKVLLTVLLLFSGHTYSNLSLHPFHLFFSWFFFFNSLSMLWEYWEAFFLPLSDVESNSIFKSLDVSDAHSPLYPPPNISKVNTIILEWILHFIYWCLNRWK